MVRKLRRFWRWTAAANASCLLRPAAALHLRLSLRWRRSPPNCCSQILARPRLPSADCIFIFPASTRRTRLRSPSIPPTGPTGTASCTVRNRTRRTPATGFARSGRILFFPSWPALRPRSRSAFPTFAFSPGARWDPEPICRHLRTRQTTARLADRADGA